MDKDVLLATFRRNEAESAHGIKKFNCGRYPFRDFERDSEFKTALSQKLLTLAAEGVTDPNELREWALESPVLR
jgi:hypothetical protein